MNIILLSGGSGKRLWPLSNGVRSKQFIKILKDENDKPQSMLQRIYSQIQSSDENSKITIATSKAQASQIRSQIGEKVSICVEPCRRDTFPAIVLAANYLHERLNVSRDEACVVCPVDPYVEEDYIHNLEKLSNLAQSGKYNLNLVGVEPNEPSEKYGYIIPKTRDIISEVSEFKEKPDRATAENYIKEGALWNCGVFAFKLGYLLDIADKLIDYSGYDEIFKNYENMPKISFDYAVVEKESSIGVLRFSGKWEDLGSWNTFTDHMQSQTIGECILGGDCSNTKIINELSIPLIAMGAKDMIIAAGSDGILVSSKKDSDGIKPYVDKIDQRIMYEEKSWGSYNVLEIGKNSLTIKAVLKKGHGMSYHSHEFRNEIWTITEGTGFAVINGERTEVKPGDILRMNAGDKHTIFADEEIHLIEVQIGENITSKDKIKYGMP